MKEMQRYEYCSTCICPLPKADGRCLLVLGMALLADAEAAIAAAFQGGMGQMIGGIEQVSYDKGQRDMLAKCIAAVEDLFGPDDYELRWLLDGQAVHGSLRALVLAVLLLAAAVQRVESLASGPEEMYEVADMYWAAVAAIKGES